jgi:hypothetical protein
MEENRTLLLNGTDAMVMLYHVHRAAEEFGHMDADQTLQQLIRAMSFPVKLPCSVVESGLFSCNQIDEKDPEKFWHPLGMNLDEYIRKLLKGKKFDKRYHLVVTEE